MTMSGTFCKQSDFEKELTALLNKHNQENASNTPDYILAQYLTNCLAAWNSATQQRDTHQGRNAQPTLPPQLIDEHLRSPIDEHLRSLHPC